MTKATKTQNLLGSRNGKVNELSGHHNTVFIFKKENLKNLFEDFMFASARGALALSSLCSRERL